MQSQGSLRVGKGGLGVMIQVRGRLDEATLLALNVKKQPWAKESKEGSSSRRGKDPEPQEGWWSANALISAQRDLCQASDAPGLEDGKCCFKPLSLW